MNVRCNKVAQRIEGMDELEKIIRTQVDIEEKSAGTGQRSQL